MHATAQINVARPTGRILAVERTSERTYTLKEVFEEGEKILSNHYGVEIKLKH